MNRLQKKPSRFRGAWLIAVLGVVAVLAVGSLVRETLRSRQIDREIAALQAESASLQARNFELLSMNANLGTPDSLERKARLDLNLRKDGEQVVILRPAEPSAAPPVLESQTPWSNPSKWWAYFTDRSAYDEHLRAARANP
jgi:cell division protein FtsB